MLWPEKDDNADENESDDNSMLWLHLSQGPPPSALSQLNSEKSEQYAPLFASDHISHRNLDLISYFGFDSISI